MFKSIFTFSPIMLKLCGNYTFHSNRSSPQQICHGVKPTTAITPAAIQSQHVGEPLLLVFSWRNDLQGALCVAKNSGY